MALAKDHRTSTNDALAYLSMKAHRLKETYSFDKHFDQLKDMRQPILIDGRRIYNPEEFSQKLKFVCHRLGK